MGKEQSFQQIILGKMDLHMQNNEVGLLANIILKNSKWIMDLNVKPKRINLLEENIGQKLQNIELGNDFLAMN